MLVNVILNNNIPFIGDYVKIVCAICNAYRPPWVNAMSLDDDIIAQRMLALTKKLNNLQKIVKDKHWSKKKII